MSGPRIRQTIEGLLLSFAALRRPSDCSEYRERHGRIFSALSAGHRRNLIHWFFGSMKATIQKDPIDTKYARYLLLSRCESEVAECEDAGFAAS